MCYKSPRVADGVRRLAGGMARDYRYQAGPNLSSLAARPTERLARNQRLWSPCPEAPSPGLTVFILAQISPLGCEHRRTGPRTTSSSGCPLMRRWRARLLEGPRVLLC